jgi:hypothetical protein
LIIVHFACRIATDLRYVNPLIGLVVSVSAAVKVIAISDKATKTIPKLRYSYKTGLNSYPNRAGIIKNYTKIGNRQPLS